MQLVVLGLNHRTAPVEVRECFSFSEEQIKAAYRRLHEYDDIRECVILSTCNRTEMYAVVEDADDALAVMQEFLDHMAPNVLAETSYDYLFYYQEEECIRHLFRVSASLDSLVLGEGQILSQVKSAYAIARIAGTTSTVLNTLFNRAIAVGKKVRTATRIAYNAVSVSYAAVELAKKVLGDLSASNVLVLGAGEMSELTARHLVASGVKTVFVSNRNFERALALADKFRGVAVPFEDFLKCAVDADIVITSTGAPHYIIQTWDVAHLMPKRQGRPIFFIDIAVPRDIEPEVGAIAGVTLYNIDDLEAVVESNMRERQQEAAEAERLVDEEMAGIIERFRYLSYRPTLARLTDKAERIRQREIKRALTKLPDITPDERRILENMSKMIIRKLLRDPIIRLHEAAGTDKEYYYQDAIRKLFKLDIALEVDREDQRGEERDRETKTCHRYARQ
ncbi:glutamyl-tRNA reductase [Sporomusa acidovorans]|uniref:Glutamyl-tRNA reductase n=1 Tax=Sporomusa acidovorans (strain ATCC 49682 / DSM 3132 / Mol) TaxID=1123286 RepID=A0ABZ3JAC2_SPOA4|nr:glutamyl-tRNA reductase [Sporomusa acidovorans]OZC22921.1 glutamyl-tRNA reductase [Sporomusa acidovorans DSM 3132]SDE95190.1 glutamyl-tRNA reductase [Sporomusa acidovorans]